MTDMKEHVAKIMEGNVKPMMIDGEEHYPQIVSPEFYRDMMLLQDTYGIYKQRRMRGVQVWRGHEWWHG